MSHPATEPGADQTAAPPPLQNATRYLSAGAYLDSRFRDRVLDELMGDPHRAVAPSLGGWNLTPVLTHCLRAQQMTLIRDALITGTASLLGVFGWNWICLLLPLALLSLPRVRRGPRVWRVLLILLTVAEFAVLPLFLIWMALAFLPRSSRAFDMATGTYVDTSPSPLLIVLALLLGLLISLLISFLPLAIAAGYRINRYVALSTELRPGATLPPPGGSGDTGWRRSRKAYLDQAQWGNITLFGADDPFVGAGSVRRSWSIVAELDRTTRSDNSPAATPRDYARIDPADLHSFVRQRLLEMRDAVNEAPERVSRMHVGDHLTARGTFTRLDWPESGAPRRWSGQSHPLIDTASGLPHFVAPPEVITDVIRQPQGGLKHYQRVTVDSDGEEMVSSNGSLLAPGEDRQVSVSAFIHLAVEGRMLYTQFVLTVLPPVAAEYRVVDELPALTGPALVWRAVSRNTLDLIADTVFAPFRLVRVAVRAIRWRRETRNPAALPVYPFGARRSVRELGSAYGLGGFIQRLDADKYVKLIERRLTEAVLDYLDSKDIDTSGYRAQASNIINNGALITGGTFNGPVAAGTGASASQHGGDK
ncbi:hypothetical protein [Streptosporangium carneum]|uniref:Uncharacterized protein n=1 Tax=Streptosporangium carneum TaxID=47481 RepID=A0A9W6I1K4_9ACTN|nr:hypothetical protein [Streptosporangium carneum]GLK09554.1 hypothetical protein GCM10017600_29600 [Streptosporangium carneum]